MVASLTLLKTFKDLRKFLFMVNYYRRFLLKATYQQSLLNVFLLGRKTNESSEVVGSPQTGRRYPFEIPSIGCTPSRVLRCLWHRSGRFSSRVSGTKADGRLVSSRSG